MLGLLPLNLVLTPARKGCAASLTLAHTRALCLNYNLLWKVWVCIDLLDWDIEFGVLPEGYYSSNSREEWYICCEGMKEIQRLLDL